MNKMLCWILGVLLLLYVILNVLHRFMPDWFRILWNADPKYIDHAIEEAKRTYYYDKEN